MGMAGGSSQGREEDRRPLVNAFDPCFEPLVAVIRGEAVESVHRGAVTVVGPAGELLGGVGDPGTRILLRSAAKPFQAAAVVASGAAEAFSLTDEEIAVMAGSHTGTAEHVAVVARILRRAGATEASLVCGSSEHMCSGKHAGMLLLAEHLRVSAQGYELQEHPVQRAIRGYVTSLLQTASGGLHRGMAGNRYKTGSRTILAGIDGCGVPVISLSLYDAAHLFALLASGATPTLARVRDAMLAHPVLVAGQGRLDTTVMQAGEGAIIAKGGAEGVQGIGLTTGAGGVSSGGTGAIGAVVKVEDGSGRPIPAVVCAFLRAWDRGPVATAVEQEHSANLRDWFGREARRMEVVTEPAALRRAFREPPGGSDPSCRPAGVGRLTSARGNEKEVLRFLRDQWPDVDREYFDRTVEWTAEPFALVYRIDRKVAGVLRGHFVGGVGSVDELMVGAGHRGCGIGSLLLGRFEDEAERRDCSRIVLRAVKGTRAEDFYRGRGYHRESVQYGYEFGYDYVRLTRGAGRAPGEAGSAGSETKGET